MLDKTMLVEAHRGYCAQFPENTLPAFEAAMDLGVDGVEMDIRFSADQVPMVIHDATLLRTCGAEGKVSDLTLEQLKELSAHYPAKFGRRFADGSVKIPTLEELLQLRARKRPDLLLGVELKETSHAYVDAVVTMLDRYGVLDFCCFFTYDAPVVEYAKKTHGVRTMGFPDFNMRNFGPDSYACYDEICLSVAQAKSEIFPIYEAKGLPMQMYVADTEADARVCLEKGASLAMANDPVPLLRVLGRI